MTPTQKRIIDFLQDGVNACENWTLTQEDPNEYDGSIWVTLVASKWYQDSIMITVGKRGKTEQVTLDDDYKNKYRRTSAHTILSVYVR